jgi:hypothetical protein
MLDFSANEVATASYSFQWHVHPDDSLSSSMKSRKGCNGFLTHKISLKTESYMGSFAKAGRLNALNFKLKSAALHAGATHKHPSHGHENAAQSLRSDKRLSRLSKMCPAVDEPWSCLHWCKRASAAHVVIKRTQGWAGSRIRWLRSKSEFKDFSHHLRDIAGTEVHCISGQQLDLSHEQAKLSGIVAPDRHSPQQQ